MIFRTPIPSSLAISTISPSRDTPSPYNKSTDAVLNGKVYKTLDYNLEKQINPKPNKKSLPLEKKTDCHSACGTSQ